MGSWKGRIREDEGGGGVLRTGKGALNHNEPVLVKGRERNPPPCSRQLGQVV
jgi:hypothetical protein